MFQLKRCVVITWNKEGHVYAIKYSIANGEGKILKTFFNIDEKLSFSEKIKAAYNDLDGFSEERIIMGGYFPSAVVFDISVPSLPFSELGRFLSYELVRHIPFSIDDLEWWYRSTELEKIHSKVKKVKIFAVKKIEWEKLIAAVADSGIKIDSVVYPFMALCPLYSDFDFYMDGVDDEFYLKKTEENEGAYIDCYSHDKDNDTNFSEFESEFKTKYVELEGEDYKNYIPSVVLGEYALSNTFIKDVKHNINLPDSFKPKRFRYLKVMTVILAIVFVVLVGFHITRVSIDNSNLMNQLLTQKTELQIAINDIKYKLKKGEKIDAIIKEITDAQPNDINLMKYLEYFTEKIPGNIWVTNINSYQDKINLTLKAKGSTDSLLNEFYKSELFNLQNNRKRSTEDGTVYMYMTLEKKSKKPTIDSL